MSLFSAFKSLFTTTQPQPKSTQTQQSSVPKVKAKSSPPKTSVVPATTDQRKITVKRNAVDVEAGISCDFFIGHMSEIARIPDDFEARLRIDMTNSKQLEYLPNGLKTGSLILSNCIALAELPSGLDVVFLDLKACTSLRSLPDDLRINGGGLDLKGCHDLAELPANLGTVAGLNLSGCKNLTRIPEGLHVTSWIDITGTKIKALPTGFEHVGLRRGGAPITATEAFAA